MFVFQELICGSSKYTLPAPWEKNDEPTLTRPEEAQAVPRAPRFPRMPPHDDGPNWR